MEYISALKNDCEVFLTQQARNPHPHHVYVEPPKLRKAVQDMEDKENATLEIATKESEQKRQVIFEKYGSASGAETSLDLSEAALLEEDETLRAREGWEPLRVPTRLSAAEAAAIRRRLANAMAMVEANYGAQVELIHDESTAAAN